MFCNKCGKQNPDDAIFCIKCGNRLSSIKPEVERIGITGKLGKMGVYGFRSGKTWKMVLATFGYFWIILIFSSILVAFIFGFNSSNTLITADLSQMLPSINDMPDGSRKLSENIQLDYAERSFILSDTLIQQVLKYEVKKFSSFKEAIDNYNFIKNKYSNYKLTTVNLGNEGFGLKVADSIAMVVFRKANVVVNVRLVGQYITTLSDAIFYAEKVKV